MSTTAKSLSEAPRAEHVVPDQVTSLLRGATDALTDQMVERLSITGANALEVVDRLNDEHTRDAILTLLDELTKLHRAGGLVSLFETIHTLNAMRNALTDSIVERLTVFGEAMVTNLANEEVACLAGAACTAIMEASEEVSKEPSSGGLMASLRLLGQPETQSAMRFLVAVSRRFQQGKPL